MKKYLSVVLGALAAVAIGCGDSTDLNQVSGYQGPNPPFVDPTPTPTPTDPVAKLRLVNPSGDLDNLRILVNGTEIEGDLDGMEATAYLTVGSGAQNLQVSQDGETFIDETITLDEDSFSTAVIVPNTFTPVLTQTIGGNETDLGLDLIVLDDDVTPEAGQANARLFNAIYIDNESTLLTDDRILLLGPVAEGQVFPAAGYQMLNTNAFLESDGLLLDIDATASVGEEGTFEFSEVTGGEDVAEALDDLVASSGANITIFAAVDALDPTDDDDDNGIFLFLLLDEAESGNRAILVRGEELEDQPQVPF